MNGFRADQLDVDLAMVLVIDVQEKILPLVADPEGVLIGAGKLLDGVRVFDVPVLATEQYAKGLGPTQAGLRSALQRSRAEVLDKPTFSAWADDGVRAAILALDRPQVILAGIETHVCVQQTALDLCSRDYTVFVCADAVSGRGSLNHAVALDRMRQAGAVVTTVEAVLLELCHRTDIPRFKGLLEVIKANPPRQ